MSLFEEKIKPMLAHLAEPFDSDEFLFEIKFDGTRTIAYIDVNKKSVSFLNRRGIFFEWRYPEFKEIWKDVNAKKVVLDGELVIFEKGKPQFYLLEEREHVSDKTRIELLSKINPATYVVFDILHLDGKDLIDLPLKERKEILKKVVKESSRVILSEYVIGKGKKFFESVKKAGLEGVVAKRLNSTYQINKRSKDWLKIKVLNTLDVIICGYTLGEGKREGYFGALLCGVWYEGKLRYLGRVGTGFDEKLLRELTSKLKELETDKNPFDIFEEEPAILEKVRWVKPKLVAEVKFMNLSEDLKMRAPAFVRLREDKPLEDCILEI
jgi:DNA ligase D-like protein (predicted ligase)